MNTSKDRLLAQESHFEFGKNWASYANMITEAQIDIAAAELQHLLRGRLDGKRFLDIGCGSGLHSLAALQLGASEVVAVDIDLESVETTCRGLARHAPGGPWRTLKISVFDGELRAHALQELGKWSPRIPDQYPLRRPQRPLVAGPQVNEVRSRIRYQGTAFRPGAPAGDVAAPPRRCLSALP